MKSLRQVGSLTLSTVKPTELSLADLYTWVVWQFPRKKANGLCGAVRPPIPGHSWFPALIRQHDKRVFVYAHLGLDFGSPNEAAEWLAVH